MSGSCATCASRGRLTGYERLPEFTLEYSAQTVEGIGGFYGGELRLGLPVARWMNSGPDEAASAEVSLRDAELSTVERSLTAEFDAAYAEYGSAQQLTSDYREKLLPQARESHRIARRLFDEG